MADDDDEAVEVKLGSLINVAIREGARIVGALATIFGVLWLFGQPLLVGVINDTIDARRLATAVQVQVIEDRISKNEFKIERADDRLKDTGDAVIELKTDVGSIKELLTEQRQDIKSLLRSMVPRSPSNPE